MPPGGARRSSSPVLVRERERECGERKVAVVGPGVCVRERALGRGKGVRALEE
jgi:hypothetical protein